MSQVTTRTLARPRRAASAFDELALRVRVGERGDAAGRIALGHPQASASPSRSRARARPGRRPGQRARRSRASAAASASASVHDALAPQAAAVLAMRPEHPREEGRRHLVVLLVGLLRHQRDRRRASSRRGGTWASSAARSGSRDRPPRRVARAEDGGCRAGRRRSGTSPCSTQPIGRLAPVAVPVTPDPPVANRRPFCRYAGVSTRWIQPPPIIAAILAGKLPCCIPFAPLRISAYTATTAAGAGKSRPARRPARQPSRP